MGNLLKPIPKPSHEQIPLGHDWDDFEENIEYLDCKNCGMTVSFFRGHPESCRYPKGKPKGLCNFYLENHWCAWSIKNNSSGEKMCTSCGFLISEHWSCYDKNVNDY